MSLSQAASFARDFGFPARCALSGSLTRPTCLDESERSEVCQSSLALAAGHQLKKMARQWLGLLLLASVVGSACATVFFEEKFGAK